MPGEFVASPKYIINSQPIWFSYSQSQASDSKADQKNMERRPSLETLDSIAKEKQASSSPPSRMRSALDKAKRKMSIGSKDKDVLAGSEEEYERQKQKEAEKQKRKEEYARLGLSDKVKFGQGGMQMSG